MIQLAEKISTKLDAHLWSLVGKADLRVTGALTTKK